MKKFIKIAVITILFLSAAAAYSDPSSWLIGEWYSYGTYNLDKDGVPDDISFVFNEDGTYHSKFYRNLEKNEGLILEAKGTYTFTGGVEFNWERSHRIENGEWADSIKKGTFYIYRKGVMLELRTDKYVWLLERR